MVEINADPSVKDYTPVVRQILEQHPRGHVTLKFSPGTFRFFPEEAFGEYMTVSNNDNGMKRIIFRLKGMKNVTVEGDSSDFVFHGAVIPFAVTDSRHVRISGISIDYDAPFTLEGTVTATDKQAGTFTLKIDPANKYRIMDERFYFLGYGWESRLGENVVFDPETKSPYYNAARYQHWPVHQFSAREVGEGLVEFGNVYAAELPPVGSVWVDKGVHPQDRYCSAIVLSDSGDITVEDVHIYHSGAMSLVAQYCEDVTVRRFDTSRRPGSSRMVTSSADATHFVDCSGDILIEDCRFESMLDDAVNIHGVYMKLEKVLGRREFAASFGHRQQTGNRFADKGDVILFMDRSTMQPVGTGRVREISRVNENRYVFRTDFPVETLQDSGEYAIENISRGASAVIRNCSVKYNRARSLLLSTPGQVLVEDCSFASMMAGIVICGDANFWFESGRTRDIVIRNCEFQDLARGGNGPQAVLQIDPMIPEEARTTDFFYHGHISFTGNTVRTFDSQIIYARSVADLDIRDNVFVDSGTWKPLYGDQAAIDVEYCGNVTISGNDFSGWKKDACINVHDCIGADIHAPGIKVTGWTRLPRTSGSEAMEDAIAAYVSEAAADSIPIHSLMVVQNGSVTAEAYLDGWTAADPHRMWSVSKTFTSLAVGYAVEEGLLALDEKIAAIFPEEAAAVLDTMENAVFRKHLMDADVRDFLVMATGQTEDPTYVLGARYAPYGLTGIDSLDVFMERHGGSLIADFFSVPFTAEPGTVRCYNSIATYILSAAVQKVSGEKLVDYLYPRLFEPLGIEKPRWDEVQGINCGGWGLWLKPEDMARAGQAMLCGGRYAGRQVIPERYLEEAAKSFFTWDLPTGKESDADRYHATGYGYQIWRNPDSFYAAGMWGQFIYVFPELDAVVVATADVRDDDSRESALIWKHIVPVLKAEAGAGQRPLRWALSGPHSITWNVRPPAPGHRDHLEMSGERISVIYEYGVDDSGAFSVDRNVIWPLLRKYPNDTYGHTSMRFSQDFLSGVTADGTPIGPGTASSLSLDGKLNVESRHGALKVSRCLFPSTVHAAVCEEYVLTNISDSPVTVRIPAARYSHVTEAGVYGAYTLVARTSHSSDMEVKLEPSASARFCACIIGSRYPEVEEYIDVPYEKKLRDGFVEEVCTNLVLDTPDPILNAMFAFAKIRGSESLFRTKGGLTHSPGGGYYYSAVWANDQAEYICPFFPFLGYAGGNEAAMNAFLHFAEYMNDAYAPVPSSLIAEFTDIWNGCGDRGDAAMIAYGAGRYALARGDADAAQRLWPLIKWCLEYCRLRLTPDGVVASDTDELENRFPSGDANLCTSSLYYDALLSAARIAEEFEEDSDYMERAHEMRASIEKYFGADVAGFRTYRYYDGNELLRSWICIPLVMGIYDRAPGTADALLSDRLWTENGILTQEGSDVFWDRATLYALRGILAAGRTEDALSRLQQYSSRRLLGEHVPYAIEAWPENDQRHLSAESGLYCRVYTEGLFGFRPEGFRSFSLTPRLPSSWKSMSLKKVHACSDTPYDIEVRRLRGDRISVSVSMDGRRIFRESVRDGGTVEVSLAGADEL